MSITVTTLHEKQPGETVTYYLDLSPISSIGDSTVTLSSATAIVYDDDDNPGSPTDIAAMHPGSVTVSASAMTVALQVTGGTNGKTYVIRFLVTCSNSDIYEVEGRFKCVEKG